MLRKKNSLLLVAGILVLGLVTVARVQGATEVSTTLVYEEEPLELTGTVELFPVAGGEQTVTIVDPVGARYFIVDEEEKFLLREKVGETVKVEYVVPRTPTRLVKIRSMQMVQSPARILVEPRVIEREEIIEKKVEYDDGEVEVEIDD